MARSSRRPRRSMNQINVVPYIDVMLVLLVIFMVTTPMMQPGVINLPKVGKADRDISAEPLRVAIGAEGALTVTDKNQSEKVADVDAMVALLRGKLAGNTDRPVVIEGDKTVRYETVVNVMDALRKAEIARVGLMVQPGK
ncbi:Biopolymer transport protein ExbD [Andreprevotia sp. IGB-42]|uniref:protein TolR n=1 Tax=Andreprevotia sp. IGB-42 TaxID=2497473 RepID=UPI00135AFEAD|nr:protein TolR [Andreprevotia sp. IGB-42]KAF0812381.1 Biopolymer transport protein ExbD [Andreprevotia sp. IGB-42]